MRRTIRVMAKSSSFEEKRQRFQQQISELYRLADEAELCANLLRQQADTHKALLEDDTLTETQLDSLLSEKPKQKFTPGAFVVTEGLM